MSSFFFSLLKNRSDQVVFIASGLAISHRSSELSTNACRLHLGLLLRAGLFFGFINCFHILSSFPSASCFPTVLILAIIQNENASSTARDMLVFAS